MELKGKTAIVTGAAQGIGYESASLMAKRGANVVISDINKAGSEAAAAKIGENACAFAGDISDLEYHKKLVEFTIEKCGRIDILVNNAALWRDKGTFVETSAELWQKYLDINIMGVVYCTKAVLPKMIENNYGRIINVASVAGVYGNAKRVHYSTTKGALIAMTKALAKEVLKNGVLVNCVSPGSVSPADNPDMNYYKETNLSYTGRTGTDMENANLI